MMGFMENVKEGIKKMRIGLRMDNLMSDNTEQLSEDTHVDSNEDNHSNTLPENRDDYTESEEKVDMDDEKQQLQKDMNSYTVTGSLNQYQGAAYSRPLAGPNDEPEETVANTTDDEQVSSRDDSTHNETSEEEQESTTQVAQAHTDAEKELQDNWAAGDRPVKGKQDEVPSNEDSEEDEDGEDALENAPDSSGAETASEKEIVHPMEDTHYQGQDTKEITLVDTVYVEKMEDKVDALMNEFKALQTTTRQFIDLQTAMKTVVEALIKPAIEEHIQKALEEINVQEVVLDRVGQYVADLVHSDDIKESVLVIARDVIPKYVNEYADKVYVEGKINAILYNSHMQRNVVQRLCLDMQENIPKLLQQYIEQQGMVVLEKAKFDESLNTLIENNFAKAFAKFKEKYHVGETKVSAGNKPLYKIISDLSMLVNNATDNNSLQEELQKKMDELLFMVADEYIPNMPQKD